MKKIFVITRLMVVAFAGFTLLGVGSCHRHINPIIFVHGGSGSGGQFESQAMRFTSNGYPQSYLRVLEYNSSAIGTILPDVHAALDDLIAELQATTGHPQVDLMGHSLGGYVSLTYLADPNRAQNIAHYISLDSGSSEGSTVPNGVNALALWAGGVDRPVPFTLTGATNITIPNQEHIQVATSEESFFEMYQFLRGHAPKTTKIRPQLLPRISGRVVSFPDNFGLDGATLEIWPVQSATGERIGSDPLATYEIGPDGNFGPFQAVYGAHYEFAVIREGSKGLSYYFEPFIRSDHLVRVNVAVLLDFVLESSPDFTSVTVVRYKEFWGDKGPENDVLAFNGTDVITPDTAPSGVVGAAPSAMFVYDVGKDGVSTLAVPAWCYGAGFLSGADLFIPSSPPGTVSIETVPRGDFGAARTLNVPNTPSSEARIAVQLYDFEP